MSHAQSYHFATGGRTTKDNLAPSATQHPVSHAGDALKSRQGYSGSDDVQSTMDDDLNLARLNIDFEDASQDDGEPDVKTKP
jgi:hypothetical protein